MKTSNALLSAATILVVAAIGYSLSYLMRHSQDIGLPGSTTMTVLIPLLVDASNTDYQGPAIGCDKVVMTPKIVPAGPDVLNAAMTELFKRTDPWQPWNGTPSNFLSAHPELQFDHATLADGMASIYMTGSIGPMGGVCDDPRLQTVLEQTALQFPEVTSVKFYLNNQLVDLNFSEKE